MSAPSPATSAAPPEPAALSTGAVALRLLAMAVLIAVGFVTIRQGFGWAGYGTDSHAHRVRWACIQLGGFAVVAVGMRGWLRPVVAVAFFASAGLAWWTVRSDPPSGISLREAVERRDHYRAQLATATPDNFDRHEGLKGIAQLAAEYPSLSRELVVEYGRWKDRMWHDLTDRYNRAPLDDLKAIHELRAARHRLAEVHPSAGELLRRTEREWVSRAVGARAGELAAHGDWGAFDRTAAGRRALAEAFPETRDELVAAEEGWAEGTALGSVWLQVARGERPKADWRGLEGSLLARPAIDTSARRFAKVRGVLFGFVHDEAKAGVAAHLGAERYDAAFALARKHAVEWNATATVLGETEVKQLDELRNRCEALAKLHENDPAPAEPVEVAPAPRPRPEK